MEFRNIVYSSIATAIVLFGVIFAFSSIPNPDKVTPPINDRLILSSKVGGGVAGAVFFVLFVYKIYYMSKK